MTHSGVLARIHALAARALVSDDNKVQHIATLMVRDVVLFECPVRAEASRTPLPKTSPSFALPESKCCPVDPVPRVSVSAPGGGIQTENVSARKALTSNLRKSLASS
eukprot:5930273-Pyramimonas_sp.AAC.1